MKSPTLSVVVRAYRKAEDLAACLETLAFADHRVVVVAPDRADLTRCAKDLGALVVGENQDVLAGSADWVLSVGDDMRVSESLAKAISQIVADDAAETHEIPVRHHFYGRSIRFGWTEELAPVPKPCLQRTKGEGRRGDPLHEPVDRHLGHGISDFLKNIDVHTTIKARSLEDTSRPRRLEEAKRAVWRGFAKSILGAGGLREGRVGLVIAIGTALSPILTHLKVSEAGSVPENRS